MGGDYTRFITVRTAIQNSSPLRQTAKSRKLRDRDGTIKLNHNDTTDTTGFLRRARRVVVVHLSFYS